MIVENKSYKTVWYEPEANEVHMIDQTKLPFAFKVVTLKNHNETAEAISNMVIRGAGAIGATAGFAMAQAFVNKERQSDELDVLAAKRTIASTRPTAVNLFHALNRVYTAGLVSVEKAILEAQMIASEDEHHCRSIGEHGNRLINSGSRILTHCNAGWLAFVDYGSALAPCYVAKEAGKKIFVYVDETRPRGQGARLTAWELQQNGINHKIIADNAAAFYMERGEVEMVIVGADRIAANGDVANKIGTLEKAILASYYHIPFYVAAPSSTFDRACKSGKSIPIEERSDEELLYHTGPTRQGEMVEIRLASPDSSGLNPAFDVTPAELISGIITEKGIFKPEEMTEIFG